MPTLDPTKPKKQRSIPKDIYAQAQALVKLRDKRRAERDGLNAEVDHLTLKLRAVTTAIAEGKTEPIDVESVGAPKQIMALDISFGPTKSGKAAE